MSRDYLYTLESLSSGLLALEDVQTSWPALGRVSLDDDDLNVALFARPVTLGGRVERYDVERRFQNPTQNQPIYEIPGRLSLLIGVWDDDRFVNVDHPVIVLADAQRRIGLRTRWSAFVPLLALQQASFSGWATHLSPTGERIFCFHPNLLPLAITALHEDDDPMDANVRQELAFAEILSPSRHRRAPASGVEERARRTVSSLVRDSRFRARVMGAYNRRCAMCDIGLSLVQGAHIYPASAPDSSDDVFNGIALCANHHVAFDRHQIAVHPGDLTITHRPDILEEAEHVEATARFVRDTRRVLRQAAAGAGPEPRAFEDRYAYFVTEYLWLHHR